MDIDSYIDRVESNVSRPELLRAIAAEAADDAGLSTDELELVEDRVATYLADDERQTGEPGEINDGVEGDEDAGT